MSKDQIAFCNHISMVHLRDRRVCGPERLLRTCWR